MKLENHCISLEQAKRLKELGISQDASLFAYCQVSNPIGESYQEILPTIFDLKMPDLASTFEYSAFTVSELVSMLPYWNTRYNKMSDETFRTAYLHIEDSQFKYEKAFSGTFASSLAACLIYMLESGKVTAADCNARLIQ